METSNIDTSASAWNLLYKIGAVAALLMTVIIVLQMVAFINAPPPLEGTAVDWFTFFQQNRLLGLMGFELLMILYTVLSVPLALALYHALRPVNPAFMSLYVVLTVIGVVCFISARPALEMLSLSDQFAAATTEAQRSILLAAGEATLAAFHGTAFHASYLLGSLSGLILSLVMLRSRIFSKATAYIRIGSSLFDLGLYIPVVGIYISIFSVFFLFVWNIMVARRLVLLAHQDELSKQTKKTKSVFVSPMHR